MIKQCVHGLICGMDRDAVTNYVTAWHGVLHQLDSTPWDFTLFNCVWTFVNNLFISSAYQFLYKWINDGSSSLLPVFPDFKDIAITVLNIDIQHHHLLVLQPSITAVPCRATALPIATTVKTH